MSIVRAVIYFQLLHLIVGLSVDHCDKLEDNKYKCVFNVSSAQLSVQCDVASLVIKNLDSNIEKAFDEDKIPSRMGRLWDMCQNSHGGTTVTEEPVLTCFKITWNVGIKQFPDNFFCDGSSLIALFINNNRLNDTRKLGFSSIANCHTLCSTRIELLSVENNAFEKVFNNSFCGLQGLTTLQLNNNRIKELERDALINLKSLESMEMKNNSISVLPPGVFRQQLSRLQFLYLSNNRLDSQSIMELKNLKLLIWLDIDGNQIDVLPNDVFKHMTQLAYLALGDNLIKNLQGSLTTLRNLEFVWLSRNNISVIQSDDFKNNSIRLWSIDLSHNPVTTIEPDFCSNCDRIRKVSIVNSSLTSVPKFIFKSTNLYQLDLSSNKIDQIDARAFDASNDCYLINMSSNLLTEITNVFTYCKVKKLYLDHNKLTKLSFKDLSYALDSLSITHNNIHTITVSSRYSIRRLRPWSLKDLNLSHNHLNEIADGSLDHLTVLNVLNLDHNNLSHISQNIFKNLSSLTRLFLSHNKIITIESNAFPSQLQTLHLDNNQLTNFKVRQLDPLMSLTNLSLHGNTWSCDLSERLEEGLLKHSRIVEDICQIVCEQPNATLHRVSHSSQCPETTSINLDELNSANEINSAKGVVYANVWAWLFGLCVCIVMCK